MAKGACRSPPPPRHPRVTSDARRSTPPPAPLSDARARGKLTPAPPVSVSRVPPTEDAKAKATKAAKAVKKGGSKVKLLKKRFSPTFHRYVPSRASRRPDHARARRVVTPRKITKRDACHRAPKTLRRPLTPASAHPHRLRPKTFKAARAPKYPRVSVPPMCKLDQFQVRAARLPAGLRPLSARFRVSRGEHATMKFLPATESTCRRRRVRPHARPTLSSRDSSGMSPLVTRR